MAQKIVTEIEQAGNAFLAALHSVNTDEINTVPFEGSWTAGQVAEHILISSAGILQAVNGELGPTTRDPNQLVQQLSDIFLNFEVKMQSPDFVLPTNQPKDKETLYQSLKATFDGLAHAAGIKDLTATCLGFQFPTIGHLTVIESLHFVVVHTTRHTRQLNNIADVLNQNVI